jgi:hypothetical protein
VAHLEEEREALCREQIMLYVQHLRGILDTHTDVPVNRSMYEPGIIVGNGEEINETLETTK